MRDFTELSDDERRALRAVARHQREQRRLILQRHSALAAIRLVAAVSPTLDTNVREQAMLLARLSGREARAYENLARINPALEWTTDKLTETLTELALAVPR